MIEAPFEPELELELPARPEYVRAARHAVAALARLHGADEDVVEDIKLAVSEACTIAVNDTAEAGGQIELRAAGGEHGMTIEILDPSAQLERAVAGPPTELDTEEMPFDRMLSLPIIRGLVDDLAIAPAEGAGARLRMLLSLESSGEAPS